MKHRIRNNLNNSRYPLSSIHSDILAYRILTFLEDYGPLHCLRTCTYTYLQCLPKYHVKKEVDIYDILQYPSFRLESTDPIPIIERVRCLEIDDLYQTRKMLTK